MSKDREDSVFSAFAPSALIAAAIVEVTIQAAGTKIGVSENFSLPFSIAAGATVETLRKMWMMTTQDFEEVTVESLPDEIPDEIAKRVTPAIIRQAQRYVDDTFSERIEAENIAIQRVLQNPGGIVKPWMVL